MSTTVVNSYHGVYTDLPDLPAPGVKDSFVLIPQVTAHLEKWLHRNINILSRAMWSNLIVSSRRHHESASLADIHTGSDILMASVATSNTLIATSYTVDPYAPLSLVLHEIEAVARYALRSSEWMDVTTETVATAKALIVNYYHEVVRAGYLWTKPHVSSDAEGGITFEWWRNLFSLTFYVHPDKSTGYLLAWGLDIWNEMETGENPDETQRLNLWRRLYGSE